MKIVDYCGSASCHSADGSRLLLRLKQAQLFEAYETETTAGGAMDHVLLEMKVRNIWTSQILFSY